MLGKFTIIEDKEEVTESDNLQEIELNSNCYVNNKFIGTTVAKKATIKILNENEYELENKNIKVELGIEHYNPAQTYIGKNIEIKNAKSIKPQIKINGFSTQATRSGKNLFNASKIPSSTGIVVTDNGKTIIMPVITAGNGYTSTSRKLSELCPTLKVGDVATLRFDRNLVLEKRKIIYLSGVNYVWDINKSKTITQEMLNSIVALYGNAYNEGETEQCILTDFSIMLSSETDTSWEQYGVSPSPDYRSPIENVEGKNKVKEINWKQMPSITTGATVTNVNGYGTDYINVDNAKQYIFSYIGTAGSKYIVYYDKNKNFLGYDTNLQINNFAKWNETGYVRLRVDCSQDSVTAFQLEEGTEATDYVPYNSLEFKVEGKNRFDKSKDFSSSNISKNLWTITQLENGLRVMSNYSSGTPYIRYIITDLSNFIGKTIRAKANFVSSSANKGAYRLSICNADGTNPTVKKFTDESNKEISFIVETLEEGKNFLSFELYSNFTGGTQSPTAYVDYTDIIITIDDEDMTYEPYKSQVATFPLGNQKLMEGSYLDDEGIHHIRKKVVLDGTETGWYTLANQTGTNTSYFCISKSDMKKASTLICDKFINRDVWNTDEEAIQSIIDNFIRLRINTSRASTVAELKTWLSNNPIKVEYDLAEPETVPYTAEQQEAWEKIKNLKLFEGTNNIKSEAELTITLGKEYIIEGKYKVPKPDTEEVSAHTTFTGYDNMKNFDIPYVDNNTYPKRLDDCLGSLCQQVGLVLGSKTFPNNSYMIKGNPFTNGETCKKVLSHLVQLTGGFAEIDMENGNVYVRNFDISGDAVETIDGNNYDEFKPNNVFGPVNSIRIQMNSGVDGEETIKEAEGVTDENRCQITIADNYYLTSAEERQAVINGLFNALNGLTYLPIELSYYGYPWLKLGNKIKVKDKNDKEYITYVMEHTLKYNGAYSGIIKATALTKTQVAYTETLSIKQWKRNTELSVSKIEGKITQLTEETTENSQKLTQQEQDINGLKTKVSNIQDLTQTTIGNKTIILSNCAKGDLLSLKIKGNNTVFKYLYPSEALYPTDDLYPAGDSRILVNDIQYELGVLDTLRQNGEVYDEFVLENGQAKVIRRINTDGTVKTEEMTEDLGKLSILLNEGTNTIKILNYTAEITAKYIIKSDYTEAFATKLEMNSSIEQTAEKIESKVSKTYETLEDARTQYSNIKQTTNEISTQVVKKVGKNEIISSVNQSAEQIQIEADKININGTVSANGNFKVDTNGNMECNNGKFNGGTICLKGGTRYNTKFKIIAENGDDNTSISPTNIFVDSDDGGLFINGLNNSYQQKAYLYTDEGDEPNLYLYAANKGTTRIKPSGIETPTLTQTSKAESKKNFENLSIEEAKEILNNTDIYKYNLKTQEDNDKKYIGFVIGDDYNYAEEITSENNDGANIYSMTSVLYTVVQEQQKQINQLQEKIEKLEGGQDK